MHPHRTPARRGLAALMLSFALVAGLAGGARADVDPLWDHYKVYEVTPSPGFAVPITLIDQFGITSHNTQFLDMFANPVEKRHGTTVSPIHDPRLHYMWWKIEPEVVLNRDIIAVNQFGEQSLHIDRAIYLLNPANKNLPIGAPLPDANHYKCYSCSGPPVLQPVTLIDQFYGRQAQVFAPRFFCTPVAKIFAGTEHPIRNPNQHYTVYDIDPGTPIWQAGPIQDQFIAVPQVQLTFDRLLVVPTEKVIPTPAAPSTWGRVKSQYR